LVGTKLFLMSDPTWPCYPTAIADNSTLLHRRAGAMKGDENRLVLESCSYPADGLRTSEFPIGSEILYFC
jgi:hypothetical protein